MTHPAHHDDPPPVLPPLGVVRVARRARGQFAHPLDGRYGALDPAAMRPVIGWLARHVDCADVDRVVGIPEGGAIPAYAFAAQAGLPIVLASIWQVDDPGVVSFREEHDPPPFTFKHIYGLARGERVVIVEDEVTTGRTVVNCVRALRAAGIRCEQVATIYAADDPAMRALLASEGIRLTAVGLFAPDTGSDLYLRDAPQ